MAEKEARPSGSIPVEVRGRVLLVEADAAARERMGSWMESAGFEVISCPGPSEPDYTCVGSRGKACPLVDAADVVVLNLWLESDTMVAGTPGWELLNYYRGRDKPVVALTDAGDPVRPTSDSRVVVLRGPTERDALVEAILEVGGSVFGYSTAAKSSSI